MQRPTSTVWTTQPVNAGIGARTHQLPVELDAILPIFMLVPPCTQWLHELRSQGVQMPIRQPEGTLKASAVPIIPPTKRSKVSTEGPPTRPGSLLQLPRTTHTHTSNFVKYRYDSHSLANSNRPVAKNPEGMIHDRYNPPHNLQSMHKVFTFTHQITP